MKTALPMLTMMFLAAAAGAAEPASTPPARDKAEALLQVMQTDQLYLAALHFNLQKDIKKEDKDQQEKVDCFMSSDFGFFRAAFVERL